MIRLMPTSALWLLLFLTCTRTALGQSQDRLSSPSQVVRDSTAEVVRLTFVPTARSKWEPTLAAVRQLVSRDSVVSLLEGLGATSGITTTSGRTTNESFRLDDEWVLTFSSHRTDAGAILHNAELHESMQTAWVAPPAGFTGTWRIYFINGHVSREVQYAAGAYSGSLTMFRSDCSRAVVQHFHNGVVHGDDAGYFPSGAIMYRGRYENGVQVGTWVHYKEDGTVRERQEHPSPES